MTTVTPPIGVLADTADRDPFPFYEALHASGPIIWSEGAQAWIVSSLELAKEPFPANR